MFPRPVSGISNFAAQGSISSATPWEGKESYSLLHETNSLIVGSTGRYIYSNDNFEVVQGLELTEGTYTPSTLASALQTITGGSVLMTK